jgi:hypothetical protein
VNLAHRWLCCSAYWRNTVETYILPWVLDGLDIGTNVLEVGPGPGVTTDLLRGGVGRLTCVEIDRAFAASLSRRMSGFNVTVVCQDATAMSFPERDIRRCGMFHYASSCLFRVNAGSTARRSRSRPAPRRSFCRHGQSLQPFISFASPPRHNGACRSMYISRAPQASGAY